MDSPEACWGHVAQCKIRATGILLHSWAVQLREQCPKDFPQHGYGCVGWLQGGPATSMSFKCYEHYLI